MTEKLWGGRFSQPTDKFVEEFTASIQFDQRLYRYDIQGSIAHCPDAGQAGDHHRRTRPTPSSPG